MSNFLLVKPTVYISVVIYPSAGASRCVVYFAVSSVVVSCAPCVPVEFISNCSWWFFLPIYYQLWAVVRRRWREFAAPARREGYIQDGQLRFQFTFDTTLVVSNVNWAWWCAWTNSAASLCRLAEGFRHRWVWRTAGGRSWQHVTKELCHIHCMIISYIWPGTRHQNTFFWLFGLNARVWACA